MIPDYFAEFPIPKEKLPEKLRFLFEPVTMEPDLQVEVTSVVDIDQYGPQREYIQMFMALSDKPSISLQDINSEIGDGVVSYSVPDITVKGGLAEYAPSISGLDYLVASRGDGSFYTYSLAEKVWMTLGLSPRCIGGNDQKIVYDDLSLPFFGVAEGEVSKQYYFSSSRDVSWKMSNQYLRKYLWMRGTYAVRAFYYQTLVPNDGCIKALLNDEGYAEIKPNDGWFELSLQMHEGKILLQLWAVVTALEPELCPEQSADGLYWPDVAEPMTKVRANNILNHHHQVFLSDRFFERYEQNSFYKTVPFRYGNSWQCNPSYHGQWAFTDCTRVGRNLIKVSMRELYKPKPDREILHAHGFAVSKDQVAHFDMAEEHIASKTQRLLDNLLDLNDLLRSLGETVGANFIPDSLIKFSREEVRANHWLHYPELCRLAQVAPLEMTEQAFLSRCKNLHELWQGIPNGYLRALIICAGHEVKQIKDLGSIKLLQALTNILERLNASGETCASFAAGSEPGDWSANNHNIAPLFIINDLRISDAHDVDKVLEHLDNLDFDVARLNQGYGYALDHVFDRFIDAFAHLNDQVKSLLGR